MEEKYKISEIDQAEANAYKKVFDINDKEDIEKKTNINMDELDEAEANVYTALFDKSTGGYIEVNMQVDKEKEKVIEYTSEEKNISDLDKFLNDLMERNDIKSISIDINVDGKTDVFKTSKELNITRVDIVDKIKASVKDFKDIVIVHSKEEFELLQKQYRKEHGLESPEEKKNTQEHKHKSYSDIKAAFIAQIKENENMSKGYIRISDDDFNKLGDILDKNEIPSLTNKSYTKEGTNIIVPDEKMDQLKKVLKDMDIECLQIVHGNIDWKDIKDTSKPAVYTTKSELLNFQKENNDKFNYIAFENGNRFTVYVSLDCDIELNKSIEHENKKTLSDVKKQVDNSKKNTQSKDSSVVDKNKSKVEKEK